MREFAAGRVVDKKASTVLAFCLFVVVMSCAGPDNLPNDVSGLPSSCDAIDRSNIEAAQQFRDRMTGKPYSFVRMLRVDDATGSSNLRQPVLDRIALNDVEKGFSLGFREFLFDTGVGCIREDTPPPNLMCPTNIEGELIKLVLTPNSESSSISTASISMRSRYSKTPEKYEFLLSALSKIDAFAEDVDHKAELQPATSADIPFRIDREFEDLGAGFTLVTRIYTFLPENFKVLQSAIVNPRLRISDYCNEYFSRNLQTGFNHGALSK